MKDTNEIIPFSEKIKSMWGNVAEGFLKFIRNPSGVFALFVIVLILLNLVASRAFFRWDITSPKSYSLSASSREIVKTVDEPLSIKVFFSSNLQAPYSSTYQYVKDILSEYKSAGNENFSYEFYDMNKEENQRLASSLGIQQLQIREIKNNEVGFKNVFMGMAISYSDQTEILNGLTSSEGMEYRITDAINKVISNTNALLGLSDGVSVTLYKSSSLKDINMIGFDDLESVVKSCVDTLNRKYENRLSFNVVDPSSEEVEKLIERYGVPSYNLESQVATMCIVLENAGRSRVVPFTIQQELSLVDGSEGNQYSQAVFRYAIRGIETLDSSIDESLKALASNVNSVAYVTGHGELALSDEQSGASALSSILSEHYSLKEVNLSESDIPLSVSCVMINGPKTPFTQTELYKLDQFLMNGGNLLMFLDPFDPDPQRDENGMPVYTPLDTGLDKLLEKYGIAVNREYVMDEKCAETENQWTGKAVDLYYAPMLESDSLNQKHAITKNLGYVMFFLPGSIDVSAAEKISGEKVSVLATSSDKSWTESEGMTMEPEYMSPPDAASEKRSNLAVLVEGKFSSAFESAPAKEVKSESSDGEEGDAEKENAEEEKTSEESVYESSTHLLKSVQEGKVLVVSTSFVSGPYLSQSIFQNTGIFVENAVDYMSENEDLCSMRTKGLSLATLDVKSNGFANFVKYFNEIGLAVIVAIVGLMVMLARKKRRALIRMKYNPTDSREDSKSLMKVKASRKGGRNE